MTLVPMPCKSRFKMMTITIKTLKITKDLIFCRIWSHLVHNVLLTLTIPLEPDQRKAGERWVAVPCKFPPRHRQHRRHLRKNGASGAGLIFLQWTTACFNFHQMAVHKRTTILAHCNLKQNMWLCSKQSSIFPFMHCLLVANRKMRWSIVQNGPELFFFTLSFLRLCHL